MKRIIVLSFLILLSHKHFFAQNTEKTKKFYVGVFISADYSFRSLDNSAGNSPQIVNTRNNLELPIFGYTSGLEFAYKANKHLQVTLGTQYSLKGFRTRSVTYIYPFTNTNFVDPTSGYLKYNYSYIDIPLRLDLYLTTKKIAPFITTGVSTNIFLFETNTSYAAYADRHQSTKTSGHIINGYYKINPQFQIGMGIDFRLKRSHIRVLPIYRISVSNVYSNSGALYQYFYSFGFGINYFFRS